MKHAKKLASLLLALIMLLALGTTAFAAENNDGSITITNATVGKNYSVYKVFDLTYDDSTPDDVKVAYTYTPTGAGDAFLTALQDASSPFTLTDQNNGKYDDKSEKRQQQKRGCIFRIKVVRDVVRLHWNSFFQELVICISRHTAHVF